MAPAHLSIHLNKRDGATLSTGAIAGIIVGIVVVASILLALLIWRLLAYRKNIDPFSAKSLDSRAREKALSQTRGEHIRSTRPRDRDTMGTDERRGLVGKQSSFNEGEEQEVMADGEHNGDIDSNSINGTVNNDDDNGQGMAKERLNEKRMDQERDMEIHQGHHDGPAHDPTYGFSHEADQGQEIADHHPQRHSQENRQSVIRGCTTM